MNIIIFLSSLINGAVELRLVEWCRAIWLTSVQISVEPDYIQWLQWFNSYTSSILLQSLANIWASETRQSTSGKQQNSVVFDTKRVAAVMSTVAINGGHIGGPVFWVILPWYRYDENQNDQCSALTSYPAVIRVWWEQYLHRPYPATTNIIIIRSIIIFIKYILVTNHLEPMLLFPKIYC